MDTNMEFNKVMTSFIYELKNTFPEYTSILDKWCLDMDKLFVFCKKKYPKCHKDILNKNVNIFNESSKIDTEFLPHIHFKNLWQYEDLSVSNKEVIWGYLKLILLSLKVEDYEDINLDEAFNSVQELFKTTLKDVSTTETATATATESSSSSYADIFNNIDISNLLDHTNTNTNQTQTQNQEQPQRENSKPTDKGVPMDLLNNIFGGALGNIAKDIASEMTDDLHVEDTTSIEDAMKKLFSNPTKIASLFKSVSDKLDSKMSSGEINNSELLEETTNIMNQFKHIPGLNNLNKMFTDLDSIEKNPKFKQKAKEEKIKERLRNKVLVNKSNNKNVK